MKSLSTGLKFLKAQFDEIQKKGSPAQQKKLNQFLKRSKGRYYIVDMETGSLIGIMDFGIKKRGRDTKLVVWSSVHHVPVEKFHNLDKTKKEKEA